MSENAAVVKRLRSDLPVPAGEPGRGRKRLAFSFRYRDLPFDAEVDLTNDMLVRMTLPLGTLPFSAESAERRQCLRSVIDASRALPWAELSLSQRQEIALAATSVPPMPCTPVSVVATVVSLLLKSWPLIELVKSLTELQPRGRTAA